MKEIFFYVLLTLFFVFLVLKLENIIDWSWWWIWCPFWIQLFYGRTNDERK